LCDGKANGAFFKYSDALPNYYVQCNAGNAICRSCPANLQFSDELLTCVKKEERNGKGGKGGKGGQSGGDNGKEGKDGNDGNDGSDGKDVDSNTNANGVDCK
jgi:Chitin binding Peritrophin-A domain.